MICLNCKPSQIKANTDNKLWWLGGGASLFPSTNAIPLLGVNWAVWVGALSLAVIIFNQRFIQSTIPGLEILLWDMLKLENILLLVNFVFKWMSISITLEIYPCVSLHLLGLSFRPRLLTSAFPDCSDVPSSQPLYLTWNLPSCLQFFVVLTHLSLNFND